MRSFLLDSFTIFAHDKKSSKRFGFTKNSGVLTHLFTLRNASPFNGKINVVRIPLDYLSCATNTANLTQFFILTGATLTGGTFNPVSAGQSVVEASTDATFTEEQFHYIKAFLKDLLQDLSFHHWISS